MKKENPMLRIYGNCRREWKIQHFEQSFLKEMLIAEKVLRKVFVRNVQCFALQHNFTTFLLNFHNARIFITQGFSLNCFIELTYASAD